MGIKEIEELISAIAGLGVGGTVAVLLLVWYRGERTAHETDLKQILERTEKRDEQVLNVIQAVSTALAALKTAIENQTDTLEISRRLEQLERKRG